MGIHQLDSKATLFEHCEQRNPGDPGRLHHHGLHLTLPQPRGQGVEVGGKCPQPLHWLRLPICGHGDPMLGRPNLNPRSLEVQLLSLRRSHPTGTPLVLVAPACTPCCLGHLLVLPPHDVLRHRGRGANQRHSSKREPTRQAYVTTDVVASPVTMLANGHKAPLFSRPLTTRCLGLEGRRKGAARQVTSRCPRSPIAYMLATSYCSVSGR